MPRVDVMDDDSFIHPDKQRRLGGHSTEMSLRSIGYRAVFNELAKITLESSINRVFVKISTVGSKLHSPAYP